MPPLVTLPAAAKTLSSCGLTATDQFCMLEGVWNAEGDTSFQTPISELESSPGQGGGITVDEPASGAEGDPSAIASRPASPAVAASPEIAASPQHPAFRVVSPDGEVPHATNRSAPMGTSA